MSERLEDLEKSPGKPATGPSWSVFTLKVKAVSMTRAGDTRRESPGQSLDCGSVGSSDDT